MPKFMLPVLTLMCLGLPLGLSGSENGDEDLVATMKAVFIYNFTKYIEWPGADTTGVFKIGVIGNSPIVAPLKKIGTENRVGNRRIQILSIQDPREAKGCRILFISGSEYRRLAAILDATSAGDVLTVGDTEGYARLGVAINFVVVEGRIKFEINSDALNRAGLKASSHLLRLAILVEENKEEK